ncbi:MAG: DNA polymerase I [Prevotellaceae bacterium]|jgi:DNA polymerase-1|nr:DNA polymerase I [Prevotellaceae bacterium]
MKKLFLLDAYALIYRAYYAFLSRPMNNSKGFNTSAVYGFTKTLLEVLQKEKPTHIGVAFDPGGETFRHTMYPAYKANRQESPEVIRQSIPVIKELVEAFNIPMLLVPGFEADDVIGTLAKKAESNGFITYMMTPDKDYGQLVSEHIMIYKPGGFGKEDSKIGIQDICKKYGIERPEQVADILALWGDATDNVPGAPGIGEKTAMKLIAQYGSLENLIANAHELKGKQRESIEQNVPLLEKAKRLVTIDLDVPVEFDGEALKVVEPNKEHLREIFTDLEFKTYLKDICGEAPKARAQAAQADLFSGMGDANGSTAINDPIKEFSQKPALKTADSVSHTYHIAQTPEQVEKLVEMLMKQEEFCFDTETDNIDAIQSNLVGISFAVKPHEAWYIPLAPQTAHYKPILDLIKQPIENESIAKIGQNIKYDYLVLKHAGINLKGKMLDTMLVHYLLEPELRHNMNYMSEIYLGYEPISIEKLIGEKGKNQGNMRNVPLEQIAEYAAEDADITIQLYRKLFPLLKQNKLLELYTSIEAPLIEVLAEMEYEGVKIDTQSLHEAGKAMTLELDVLENEIRKMADEPELNVYSPKQLGEALFDKMQIAANARTTSKSKQYSTSEETLSTLRDRHPIIDKILEMRSLKKMLSTYVDALPQLVNPETGRIHTSYNQAVTVTGRLSSNNPNLQNIPIREERGREIRKALIPSDERHMLLSADYSQVELRLMAHLSQDKHLVNAFLQNQDIHAATAAKIFHIPIEEVSKEQRRRAKTANFGIIYGISVHGLSQRLNIPRSEAKVLIDGYFEAYPQIRVYMDNVVRQAKENGYVTTLCGRKRMLPDISSRNAMVRGYAERNAINAPIQGSAADIIKLAMIKIYRRLQKERLRSRMILQVHDELVFDVPKQELDYMKKMVVEEMEAAFKLIVPLTAEAGVGENWLAAH